MASCFLLEHGVEVPVDVRTLDAFRRWALSDEFPEKGRIDYIEGNIEIDMSPENVYTHGTPKTAIVARIWLVASDMELGDVLSDTSRISSPSADLSCEPDVVFVSYEALDSGRVKLVKQKGAKEDDFIEIEGAPDLVVEIVSKSSVGKDTKRLPPAYFKAGVREYWLVDARGRDLSFVIHARGARRFERQKRDEEGFQYSEVLKRHFRLYRKRDQRGNWRYDLRVKE
jgi:Uma2 family endonuclease